MVATGCAAGAAPVQDVDRAKYQFSADGESWGGAEVIPWDQTTVPVPGGEPNATTFHLRVSDETAVSAEVYLGDWSVERGTAWFRADVDGAPGESVTLPGPGAGPGVLVNEFSIGAGDSVVLTLNVGVPFPETAQAARIDPDWGIVLREAGGGGGGGTGSIGSGSLGSGGSSAGSSGNVGSSVSGSSGSAGSSAGSSISFGSLGGPLVPGR